MKDNTDKRLPNETPPKPDQMSHNWVGQRRGGDPSEVGSYEWVRYCSVCGIEDTGEDSLPPCVGADLIENGVI